jgi:hypothetical protein
MIENYCIDCIDCQAITQADCDACERVAGTVRSATTELKPALALDTEEEWRVHNRRDVVTSDNRYVAFATSDKHAARIVNDHNAAIHEGGPRAYLYSELQHALKSQALLVEALRSVESMLDAELKLQPQSRHYESLPWAQQVRAALKAASGLTE